MADLPRLSPIEIEILDLLRAREMYGLEMVRASTKLKRGTIYVTLDRMTDKNLVRSRAVEDPTVSGMPRRVYSLTALGQRAWSAHSAAVQFFSNGEVLT